MIKPGKIIITNKVYFEYYELERPNPSDYFIPETQQISGQFGKDLKEYEASKRSVEVSNAHWNIDKKKWAVMFVWEFIKNNQPCRAEITKDTCTIIKLIK